MTSVLIVDDELLIRDLVTDCIRSSERSWRVATTDCIEGALNLTTTDRFCMAVLDKRLPDGSGMDLARNLYRANVTENIVMITGYPIPGDGIWCAASGISDYLIKPFPLRNLMRILQQMAKASDSPTHRNRKYVTQIALKCVETTATATPTQIRRVIEDLTPRELSLLMYGAPKPFERKLWHAMNSSEKSHVYKTMSTDLPRLEEVRDVLERSWKFLKN